MVAEYMQAPKSQPGATGLKLKEGARIEEEEESYKDIPSIGKVLGVVPSKGSMLFLGILGSILSGLVIPAFALCLGKILDVSFGDLTGILLSVPETYLSGLRLRVSM